MDFDEEKNDQTVKLTKKESKIDSFGNEQIEGAEVSWKDLSYKILGKKTLKDRFSKLKIFSGDSAEATEKDKIVLKPFSGTFKANSLVAVMGSSGAGKTTFLNALSYQMEGGVREGNVYLNNRKLTKSYFKFVFF